MNAIFAIVLLLAFTIGIFALMVMFKIKFAVNTWVNIKKTFGKNLKVQASNVCPGSDFSSYTDNDKILYDYINGTLMCPKDRLTKEAAAVAKCATAQKYIPAEVIKVYPDDKVNTLAANCSNPPGVPPTSNADWEADEFAAWKAALGTKCKSYVPSASITAPDLYKYYVDGSKGTCPGTTTTPPATTSTTTTTTTS